MAATTYKGTINNYLLGINSGTVGLFTPMSTMCELFTRIALLLKTEQNDDDDDEYKDKESFKALCAKGLTVRERILYIYFVIKEAGVIPNDLQTDFNILTDEEKKPDPAAWYLMGYCCKNGIHPVYKSFNDAFRCFSEAYKGGVKEAEIELCEACYYGNGTMRNLDMAYSISCRSDEAIYKRFRGLILLERGDAEGGTLLLEENAKEGDLESYHLLGQAYLDKKNLFRNEEKAYGYFVKGSDAGERNCSLMAGKMSYFGIGTERNSYTALFYLDLKGKDKEGSEIAGDILMEISRTEEAEAYYRNAMHLGNSSAGRKYASLLLEEKSKKLQKEGEELMLGPLGKFEPSCYLDLVYYYLRHRREREAEKMLDKAMEYHDIKAFRIALLTRREKNNILSALASETIHSEEARELYAKVVNEGKRRRESLREYHKL